MRTKWIESYFIVFKFLYYQNLLVAAYWSAQFRPFDLRVGGEAAKPTSQPYIIKKKNLHERKESFMSLEMGQPAYAFSNHNSTRPIDPPMPMPMRYICFLWALNVLVLFMWTNMLENILGLDGVTVR